MTYFHWIAGTVLALIWLSRAIDAGRGVRTLADISQPEWDRTPDTTKNRVAIVVPARNEENAIKQALQQLLALDYSNYEVIAVDDRSTDRTGEIMDEVASASPDKLKVVHVRELPPGWMGKAHAMWAAANRASGGTGSESPHVSPSFAKVGNYVVPHVSAPLPDMGSKPDWLLFTDADVMFRKDALRRAIAYAEAERADHLVVFPRLIMKRPGEKMMLAFFQLLFVFGHRPWKVADPKAKDHMGVGAFNLVRRTAYEAVGTYEALRFEVLDDMKLGKVIKNAGFRQRVVFGDDLIEVRWAYGARGVVNNLTKNFFAVMSFQTWRALLACAGMAILNLMPFIAVLFAPGWSRIPYGVALASLFFLYAGIWRQGEIHPWYFFLHPVSTTLFIYTMLRSTFLTLWNGGVEWRGTKYPLDELRKGLI
jgi:cellulose synthase/poly-beta-1,6-N-acetylglucosamine synthase-like glycosyltransferase